MPLKKTGPVIGQRTLAGHHSKHLFTQSLREPTSTSNLSKKPHHSSGTFTMSTEMPSGKSAIPILMDRPKLTYGPSTHVPSHIQPPTKSEGVGGISRNRGRSLYDPSRHKQQKQQQLNVHEMHLHPKQRTSSTNHYTPSKYPSLPQISGGESRIPVPRMAPPLPTSRLPVLTRNSETATSPGNQEASTTRLAPPRGAKFHRSESLRVERYVCVCLSPSGHT